MMLAQPSTSTGLKTVAPSLGAVRVISRGGVVGVAGCGGVGVAVGQEVSVGVGWPVGGGVVGGAQAVRRDRVKTERNS
jgi:hypothetical protein